MRAASPPTPPLTARIWFTAAAALALILLDDWLYLTTPVVLPGAEIVPTTGAVVVLGGIIVLLALGTAVELFGVNGESKIHILKSLYFIILPFTTFTKPSINGVAFDPELVCEESILQNCLCLLVYGAYTL